MIVGGHITIASSNPEADMEFFRDVLKLPNVDAGGGYVIFGLPPSEVSVHAGEAAHTLHLMCDDLGAFLAAMKQASIETSEPRSESWGKIIEVALPGGDSLHVYQPTHAHPGHPSDRNRPARKAGPRKKASKKVNRVLKRTAKRRTPAKKAGSAKRR